MNNGNVSVENIYLKEIEKLKQQNNELIKALKDSILCLKENCLVLNKQAKLFNEDPRNFPVFNRTINTITNNDDLLNKVDSL